MLITISDASLQNALRGLYSQIHEKNELIEMWRENLPTGHDLEIRDAYGQNPVKITTIIGELTIKIRDLIDKIAPDLENDRLKAGVPNGKRSKWWSITDAISQGLGQFARDFCLVVSGAIIGFVLFEGTKSPTFSGDLSIAYLFAFIALLFGVMISYRMRSTAAAK